MDHPITSLTAADDPAQPPLPKLSPDLNSIVLELLPTVIAHVQSAKVAVPGSVEDGVARFMSALNTKRAEGALQLTLPSLQAIALVLNSSLDCLSLRVDTGRIKDILSMCQTFFAYTYAGMNVLVTEPLVAMAASEGLDAVRKAIAAGATVTDVAAAAAAAAGSAATPTAAGASQTGSPSGRRKVYAQILVRKHPLWQNLEFWESAIQDALTKELNKIKTTASPGSSKYVGRIHWLRTCVRFDGYTLSFPSVTLIQPHLTYLCFSLMQG
jgi:hypothetical protein